MIEKTKLPLAAFVADNATSGATSQPEREAASISAR